MKNNENLKELLNSNGVVIVDKKNLDKSVIHYETQCLVHIDNLIEIQRIFMKCKEPFSLGLSSSIWNDIEEFKVWNRRARAVLSDNNISRVEIVINKAEKCIETLYKLNYINLITRAMNRNEICVGRPFESNLFRDRELKLADISKVSFNMIEHDCYMYLSRLKRKQIELQWGELINYFVKKHELGNESEDYILALLSYPYDSMRFIQKYYRNGIDDKKDFLDKFNEINK